MAGSPTFLGDGHTPRRDDTRWAIQQKILGALVDGGSTPATPENAGFVIQGTGVPTLKPSQIDSSYSDSIPWIYTNLSGGSQYTWNVTSQTWV